MTPITEPLEAILELWGEDPKKKNYGPVLHKNNVMAEFAKPGFDYMEDLQLFLRKDQSLISLLNLEDKKFLHKPLQLLAADALEWRPTYKPVHVFKSKESEDKIKDKRYNAR
eukprot:TRINITY_DN17915_c0_g1_i1.p2 TRINITY_DN17915_c0_g1~~TRINITY_DN17915_c0_g1_i1.p2  ORF type:complete len:112 (-),score=14.16 TRINITY_DN17915_c0_g1_i1:15-350(-)